MFHRFSWVGFQAGEMSQLNSAQWRFNRPGWRFWRDSVGWYWAVLVIVLLGFGLRAFQLGHDSLWSDEAGVALLAVKPRILDVLSASRAHAMAMPLDYVIAWGAARIGQDEFLLRFPALAWGILTLGVSYRLFRKFVKAQTALFATFLLALSSLHIHYSQEVRFYSSMVFFYCLSTLLLLNAVEEPSFRRWSSYTLACAVGAYFHVYVLLSVINGFAAPKLARDKRQRIFFLASLLVIVGAFVPGYLYFGAQQRFGYPLLQWGTSIPRIIARGLGWLALPYTLQPTWSWVWGTLLMGTGLVGVFVGLRRHVAGLAFGIVLQIVIILLADEFKGYWFVARQLVQFHPIALLFSSIGVFAFKDGLERWLSRRRDLGDWGRRLNFTFVAATGFLLASIPLLLDYYEWPKSVARTVSGTVAAQWFPGDSLLVVPGYEEKVYRFYLGYLMDRPDVAAAVRSTAWEGLDADMSSVAVNAGRQVFLSVGHPLSEQDVVKLSTLGFQPWAVAASSELGVQSLFVRTTMSLDEYGGGGP